MRVAVEEEPILLLAVLQPQLGLFPLGDVRTRSKHFGGVASRVAYQLLLVSHPAILSILSSDAILADRVSLAEQLRKLVPDPRPILRMNVLDPPFRGIELGGDKAQELLDVRAHPVRHKLLTRETEGVQESGTRRDDVLEPLICGSQGLLGLSSGRA